MKKTPHPPGLSGLSTPGERLKHVRALLRVSRAFLENKYGIPEVTLKSWENGTVKLTSSGLKRCVDIYRAEGLIVTEEWMLHGSGLDPTSSATIGQYFSEPAQTQVPFEDDEACIDVQRGIRLVDADGVRMATGIPRGLEDRHGLSITMEKMRGDEPRHSRSDDSDPHDDAFVPRAVIGSPSRPEHLTWTA